MRITRRSHPHVLLCPNSKLCAASSVIIHFSPTAPARNFARQQGPSNGGVISVLSAPPGGAVKHFLLDVLHIDFIFTTFISTNTHSNMSMMSLFQSIMTVTYIQHVHTAGKVKCFYKKNLSYWKIYLSYWKVFLKNFTSRWAPSFASSQFGEAVSFLAFGKNLHCYEHTG